MTFHNYPRKCNLKYLIVFTFLSLFTHHILLSQSASNHIPAYGEDLGLRIETDGNEAVRLEIQENTKDVITINNNGTTQKMELGNYMKPPIYIKPGYKSQVLMRMIK